MSARRAPSNTRASWREGTLPTVARRPLVVVINDDTAFLQLLEELLEVHGRYEVRTHKQWDGAYQFVKAARPDIVVLDIVMGDEERGWTILSMLTLDPVTRPIPVIVCSAALQSLRDHEGFLADHGIRTLPKPFDLDDLTRAIEGLLAGD